MNFTLNNSISTLPGVGPIKTRELASLGIKTIANLLEHIPLRHEEYGSYTLIKEIKPNQTTTLKVKLLSLKSRRSFRRRMSIQEGLISDSSDSLMVVWFNQPYLSELKIPCDLYLRGKTKIYRGQLTLVSPEIIKNQAIISGKNNLQPIYPLSGSLTTRQLRYWARTALPLLNKLADFIPPRILKKVGLLERKIALRELHFPSSKKMLQQARRRLTFEELFLLSLFVLRERNALQQTQAAPIKINEADLRDFVSQLTFKLTDAQRKAAWQIIKDLSLSRPMNRLLEGDVGSGKTVVAAMALLSVAQSGGQAVLLAPTVVLAEQHAAVVRKFLAPFKIGVGLMAGPDIQDGQGRKVSRDNMLEKLKNGQLKIVIATHAILNSTVQIKNLRLFIVDEQHRFGVKQRQILKSKVRLPNHLPHLLSMTATPIPRSLALTLYGDLDLSVIDEIPGARPIVQTKIITPIKIKEIYRIIKEAVKRQEQVFVMFPLIEVSESLAAKSVIKEFTTLKKNLPTCRIGLLHGRLPEVDKNKVMQNFRAGRIDVLATTPVIEVGIDIPNATVIVVMSADRFGLAQLHQFRGRVGRSEKKSVCLLCPDSATETTRRRLQLMTTTNDGFKLAEADLDLRGPGEIFGTSQHGQISFKYTNILDSRLLALAKEEAVNLLQKDPNLRSWPILRQKVASVAGQLHLE